MGDFDPDWPEWNRAFIEEEVRRQEALAALARLDAFRERYRDAAKEVSLSREVIRSRYEEH